MSGEPDAVEAAAMLRASAIFGELPHEQRVAIWSRAKLRTLLRGETLVRQHEPAEAVYVVVSGRFEVTVEGRADVLTEIGPGEPIGEIGFFANEPRTATVTAVRDSVALGLDRAAFDAVAGDVPAIQQSLLRALARRLSRNTTRLAPEKRVAPAHTVAIVAGGADKIPPAFFDRLTNVFGRRGATLFLTQAVVSARFPARTLDDPTVSNWLNAVEHDHELVVYIADDALTPWTQKAVRQADQVLMVVCGDATETLNPVEAFALSTHPASRRRLVLLHKRRAGLVCGTAAWLRERDVAMHHHVALEDDLDFASLHRFLTGRAVGFVAAGGGGLGSAHLGVYKAFAERGVPFDILGGVSVGAAMMAGFALLASAEEIDRGTEDIFVTSRGFKRRTLPRYALLDHIAFDDALRRQYRGAAIEDAWKPYFAVATALDGSGDGLHVFRRGPLWIAVRASGSIPAVLPPVLTADGLMLVDGGVVDNIPLRPMKAMKAGPNLVVHFGMRESRFAIDYASIPGRGELLRRMLTPGGRRKLPAIPGPIGVLQRCLVLNENIAQLSVDATDLVLQVPAFAGTNFMDFERHSAVVEAAYHWCRAQLDRLSAEGNPALAAMLAADH
jgi:NTE family protein